MHFEDRLIHFSTELIHPPVHHKIPVLQKLYYELSQTRAAYQSSDFTTPVQYRFYSRQPPNAQSVAIFLPDRVTLVEEWVDIPLSDFLEKVREVASRGLSLLGMPLFMAQTVTLRSTFSLTHFDDARVFLLDHACAQEGRIEPHFKRPIAVGGLRFVLPETPEYPYSLHVIIESFRHGVREVFVEVKGIFNNQRLDAETIDKAVDNIRTVRQFISENIYPYLNQYDVPRAEGA
jgi:hypothetical protein